MRTLELSVEFLAFKRLTQIRGNVRGHRSDSSHGLAQLLISKPPKSRPIQNIAAHLEADAVVVRQSLIQRQIPPSTDV